MRQESWLGLKTGLRKGTQFFTTLTMIVLGVISSKIVAKLPMNLLYKLVLRALSISAPLF
jgi:CBS domain containing-hemolysin-like protein